MAQANALPWRRGHRRDARRLWRRAARSARLAIGLPRVAHPAIVGDELTAGRVAACGLHGVARRLWRRAQVRGRMRRREALLLRAAWTGRHTSAFAVIGRVVDHLRLARRGAHLRRRFRPRHPRVRVRVGLATGRRFGPWGARRRNTCRGLAQPSWRLAIMSDPLRSLLQCKLIRLARMHNREAMR